MWKDVFKETTYWGKRRRRSILLQKLSEIADRRTPVMTFPQSRWSCRTSTDFSTIPTQWPSDIF